MIDANQYQLVLLDKNKDVCMPELDLNMSDKGSMTNHKCSRNPVEEVQPCNTRTTECFVWIYAVS